MEVIAATYVTAAYMLICSAARFKGIATDNFSDANKLGNGAFGVVFKGRLQDGRVIAVKRLSSNSGEAETEFRNEASLVAKLQHRNLVGLLGFCSKGTERLLVSEFVPNGSLDYYMRGQVIISDLSSSSVFLMGFHFGLVNMIATAVIIILTLLNIIVYKLRQLRDANFAKNSDISSSQQIAEANLGENLEVLTPQQQQEVNLDEDSSIPPSLKSEQLCRHFSLAHILLATNNFDDALIIGHGGFGKVYKGVIDDGTVTVAIKRLSITSKQGAPQFWTEVELLSKFRHSHIVSLIGCCNNRDEMILVYEYMARGSLADHLYKLGPNGNNSLTLSWVQRLKICIGAAQGLDYLHTGTGIHDRVIHRDLKSSNILLDDSWAAKVSDFGLSKIGPANQSASSHVSTNVKGTFGYVDPEYLMTHRLTRKSDVYSFGVVLLEVLSGRRAVDLKRCEEQWGLAGWAKECIKKGELDQIIDPNLRWQILPNSLTAFVKIADQCLHYRSKKRPTMAEVVASLESALALQERRDSSMFEADFFNLGGTFDNQENLDNSLLESEVNNGGDGEHLGEETDNILSSGEASNLQSRVRPARMTQFKRMARLFFLIWKISSEISNLESLQYDFGTLKVATDNFSDANKLGNGAFGDVFKGRLQDGRVIAVKRLSSNFGEAETVFRNEASLVAKLQHRNLVGLLGFCSKGTERLLVSEFVPNGSLDYYMRDPIKRATLDWEQRYKIIRGVARGLLYLHEDSPVRIIHRDVKPSNILLDKEMNPKISDFCLAKLCDWKGSEVSVTIVAGTYGYIAPEYVREGRVSVKSDVFGFGVLILQIISGRGNDLLYPEEHPKDLPSYARRNWREGTCSNLFDPQLSASQISVHEEEIMRCIHIGLLCVQDSATDRPTMASIVLMLNSSSLALPELSERTSFVHDRALQMSVNEDSFSSDYLSPFDEVIMLQSLRIVQFKIC
ncbi:hypothetical protein LguiA_007573 [Lonicera macranthoides]